jgi:hypothetical protein
MGMAKEYTVQELNYQHSANADSYSEDVKLAAMADAGWVPHSVDMGGFPIVHIFWQRDKVEGKDTG